MLKSRMDPGIPHTRIWHSWIIQSWGQWGKDPESIFRMLGFRTNPVYRTFTLSHLMGQMESVSLSELFELNFLEGTIKSKQTNARGFVFGSAAWAGIREDLEAVYSTGGPTIMERMGFVFGKGLIRTEWRSNRDQAAFFERVSNLAGSAGWGIVTLSAGDPTSDQARFRLKNCVFCSDIRGKTKPVCEFVAGVIRAASDELFGGEHQVTEETCVATGDDACNFLLEKRDPEVSFGVALHLF
jgi:predicted hydrocarbon binding protein